MLACAGDFAHVSQDWFWDIIMIFHSIIDCIDYTWSNIYQSIFCYQILPIVKGNDKNAIVCANNDVWLQFMMLHPLRTNMRLAQAAAALLSGSKVTVEDWQQLQYADMLIDISQKNALIDVRKKKLLDKNTIRLGFPYLKYILQSNLHEALEWMYMDGFVSLEVTILCYNNESVDMECCCSEDELYKWRT